MKSQKEQNRNVETVGRLLATDDINEVFTLLEADREDMEELVAIYTAGGEIHWVVSGVMRSRIIWLLARMQHSLMHEVDDD